MKTKTITLTHGHRNPDVELRDQRPEHLRYRVERLTDSVEYVPGQYLLRDEVEVLCASGSWKVIILSTEAVQ